MWTDGWVTSPDGCSLRASFFVLSLSLFPGQFLLEHLAIGRVTYLMGHAEGPCTLGQSGCKVNNEFG